MPRQNKNRIIIHDSDNHSFSKTDFYMYARNFRDVISEFQLNPDQYVRPFTVMINGKRRKIITYQNNDQGERLRRFHRILIATMRRYYQPSDHSYAYKHGSCVQDALSVHLESDVFLKTDIHSYFDSIDYKCLEAKFLELMGKNKARQGLLIKALQTCFYQGHLPIGFISSPMLSDLYLHEVDLKYADKEGLRYTRYADDLIISGSGEGIEEKLSSFRDELEKDIQMLGLKLNQKKTYIRKLILPGDAIHLLGLNMVKREGRVNDITVSDHYIREASKELCLLFAQKPYLEDMEAMKRFMAVMGKIDYIRNASVPSLNKLKKMIWVKSGVDADLTYKSLVKLCVSNPQAMHDHLVSKLHSAEERISQVHHFPARGKVWVRFASTPFESVNDGEVSSLPTFKGLESKVMQLCRNELLTDGSPTTLRYLQLTINGETKTYNGDQKQAEEIIHFARNMSKCPFPIRLSYEYSYDRGQPYSFKEDKNHRNSTLIWLSEKLDVQKTVIVSDDENRNWELQRETSSDDRIRYNDALLSETNDNVFQTHPEWTGEAALSAYWPLNTEEDLDARIRKAVDELKAFVNGDGEHQDGTRSISSTMSIRLSGEKTVSLVNRIRELVSLIAQADGESQLTMSVIPVDFLTIGSGKPFDYVKITVSDAGRMKIQACSL